MLMDRSDGPVPPGKLRMVVTYLEMRAPPGPMTVHPPVGNKVALMRAERPTISFYRYLYNTVGEKWLWYERRMIDEAELATIIHDPQVDISVLYVDGVPAGFVELDRRIADEVEVAFFGLVPDFMGRGFGRVFMSWAVGAAWLDGPSRVWLHSCNFDHPKALQVYQRAGFVPYKQESELIDDPRLSGLIPRDVEVRA
jgi:GNAT superfamily N-acetyltransferase